MPDLQPLLAVARRAEDRARREARRGAYRETAAFNEANLYRTIIKRSYLPKNQKTVLLAFANRWFRHQKPAAGITPGLTDLTERLGFALNTLRKHLRACQAAGFVVLVQAGRGRGNLARYAIDLAAIQEALDPGATIVFGADQVTFQGEIAAPVKGSNPSSPYMNTKHAGRRTWQPLRFRPASCRPERLLPALMGRVALNQTRQPGQTSSRSPIEPVGRVLPPSGDRREAALRPSGAGHRLASIQPRVRQASPHAPARDGRR